MTNERKFDLRTLSNGIRNNVIDEKEYEKYLKSLPDYAKNVDYIEVYEEPEDLLPEKNIGALTFSAAEDE